MATTTLGTQHMQPAEDIHAADNQPHEHVLASQPEYEIPDTKSGVRVDPDAAMASARFKKGDVVHKPVFVNGLRSKGVFTIYDRRPNPAGYVEYKLKNVYDMRVESGWTREKELKPGN
ncbi:hypothetical protein GGP41_003243 [Bipolaris sorokiniana]|uniref:Uncharacterized protein n=2 Tax=Cochliobolus sativus TaxID=45130 RepID=A0A8H5ZB34_COCSA|nr:hypothetical protein GGP41_003243 [Bipolaris sorokiniana]